MFNVEELFKEGTNVNNYIKNIRDPLHRREFETRYKNYIPPNKVIDEIRGIRKKRFIICFSGSWCKDCKAHVPILIKLLENAKNLTLRP